MQTPQCFAGPMDGSSLHSLQKLRSALQEIPRKWLQRQDVPEDEHLFGTVRGECNYNFTLKVEGGGFFQTGVLVANAERRVGGMPVPLKCRWKRRVGDVSVEIPGVTTNMYQISADDVGTLICVEAQPAEQDEGLYGAVVGSIGPFELDPATRRSLDNALGLGGASFKVAQPRGGGDAALPDLVVHVSPECVRVAPAAGGAGRETAAEYSADFPKVIIHPLDNAKFQLVMTESRTFHLLASTRASRDLIALTIRCFHAGKFVSHSSVLSALLPVTPLVPQGGGLCDERLDLCIRLERLRLELNQAIQKKEMSEKVLRNTKYEKKQLQEQLMESIGGCTDVIVGLQDQFSEGATSSIPAVPVDRLKQQLRDVQGQVSAAREELSAARMRLEELRRELRASEEAKPMVHQCREERDLLRSRLLEVTSSSSTAQQQDQADQVHALELKRLRQDVETLHNRKEQLRRQLQEKESEKQDLQDNFFYVKSQLDKWQLRVAQDADGEGAIKELDRHNQTLSNTKEERTRLSSRLEAILRDQEKEKVYHEQQLERVMTANGRLMEERDRTSREVQRLSQMYSDSVVQLQASQGGAADGFGADAGDAPGDADADPEEAARARAELQRVAEALALKEAENESLRNRIRKLAVE